MVAFYRQFIRPGDLCFDLGAHVGNRLWAWRRLGARIVALEPQPACMRLLRCLYGNQTAITLLEQAVGAVPGKQTLHLSRWTPTVSSLSRGWIAAVRQDKSFAGVRWDEELSISVTTLDALIAQFGEPVFCKIDVEGYELETFRGLSRPLRALSFEYLPVTSYIALNCLARLAELGEYEYNWSERESHRLLSPAWLSPYGMADLLVKMAPEQPPGDIFARLKLDNRV
ncbi:MAG TPA: FkbM family methyltransferase [Anaerolineales bacterium]